MSNIRQHYSVLHCRNSNILKAVLQILCVLLSCSSVPVNHLPVFTLQPGPMEVTEGSVVEIECRATGKPAPNITWFKNKSILKVVNPGIGGNESKSTFNISCSSSDDEREYTVQAENTVGKAVASFRITGNSVVQT